MKKLLMFLSSFLVPRSSILDPRAGAVTTEDSTEYGNTVTSVPPVKIPAMDRGGKARKAYFSFTQGDAAGDAGSLANLVKLPSGRVRVLKPECRVVCSVFGAARVLDIGTMAYIKSDGTDAAAAADCILDGGDISAAALLSGGAAGNALGTDPTILLDSRDGVGIQGKVAGGTIPAGATLKGFITYVIE